MIRQVIHLFKSNSIYSRVCIAGFLSSVGSGLTQISVYGELSRLDAKPVIFTAAFALSMIPGVFSSRLGAYLSGRLNWSGLLIVCELLGAVTVLVPILGSAKSSVFLLLISQMFPAIISGFAFPIIQKFTRMSCKSEEMAAVSVLESYFFSAQVIVGAGVGTLLYGQVGSKAYFLLDILSYVASAAIIFKVSKQFRGVNPVNADSDRIASERTSSILKIYRQLEFSPTRKRAFFLLPLLSTLGTPAMALLPVIGLKYGQNIKIFGLILTPALLFMFAKTLGQLLGPSLLSPRSIERNFSNTSLLIFCSFSFIGLYILASYSMNLPLALLMVISAHTLSNVIYTIGTYSAKIYFNAEEIAAVSSCQYQLQLAAITILSLIAGTITDYIPLSFAIGLGLPLVILFWIFIRLPLQVRDVSV